MTYKAINARYKTSLNNDSFTEFVVTIRSVAGENELVKFNDINNILPETAGIIAGRVAENGETYKKAAAAMKSVADNFEVYSVELLDDNGDPIFLSGEIELLFRADDYFDRTKAEVYFMDDNGAIARLSASGYGRYVAAKTSETGTFIVCVPYAYVGLCRYIGWRVGRYCGRNRRNSRYGKAQTEKRVIIPRKY